ncbi:MAG: TIGR04282 family arsenosugar biosynthesis glycosyltransferase [Verrucomicrobiota bacterium]
MSEDRRLLTMTAPPSENALLIFLKYPQAGRVKTRLAATLGAERAVEIYRLLVKEVFRNLPEDVRIIILFDPPERAGEIREWIGGLRPDLISRFEFAAQQGTGLGERLIHAFDHAFDRGFAKICAIGTDCIDLTAALFDEAWRALDHADCVLGPATDGGYYLIGLKTRQPSVFQKITWSTSLVYTETLRRVEAAGLRHAALAPFGDIDDGTDWLAAAARLHGALLTVTTGHNALPQIHG